MHAGQGKQAAQVSEGHGKGASSAGGASKGFTTARSSTASRLSVAGGERPCHPHRKAAITRHDCSALKGPGATILNLSQNGYGK